MLSHPFSRTRLSTAVLLCLLNVHAQAQDAAPAQTPSAAGADMPTIEVSAKKTDARVYDRATIDAAPEGNRDLTSLIADNPAVRLNPTTAKAGNRGSLAPEAFSIHGESPYQNQFLIDGISGTNLISPQEDNLNLQIGNVPGFAQAYNIDTDLLDEVVVYDSLVPIEFGKFTGGVIDARIQTPTGNNSFAVKRSFNSSKLTQQRIADPDRDKWVNGEPGKSAVWRKHFTSAHADLRVTERTNALLALSRRASEITRQQMKLDVSQPGLITGNNAFLTSQTSTDQVDNALLKLHTQWSAQTESSVTLKMADRREQLVDNFFADTAWTNRQQAQGLAGEWITAVPVGQLTVNLAHDQLDNLRESASTEFVTRQFTNPPPGTTAPAQYTSGGFGTESLDQGQSTAKLRFDVTPFLTGQVRHKAYLGLEAQNIRAQFDRPQDLLSYNSRLNLTTGVTQERSKNLYLAGSVLAKVNTTALYLADTMDWGRVDWTLSARVDQDDFFDNTNVSPRTRLGWDVFGNGQTQVHTGWGRYHGADLLGYALAEGKSKLRINLLNSSGGPGTGAAAGEQHMFQDVKTPYSDEIAQGVSQRLGAYLLGKVSYVQRDSRDGLRQTGTAASGYTYVNDGEGHNQTLTLTLQSTQPWQALAAKWHGQVSYSWQHNRRNHDPSASWESDLYNPDDIVEFNGAQIQYQDLPPREFHQPRRLNLSLNGEWKQAGVLWGNRVTWNSSRDAIAYIGTSKGIDRYASRKLDAYWTWDTSLTYQPARFKGVSVNVDVLNVLNTIRTVAVTNPTAATNRNAYSTGREIWLTVGYVF